MFEKMCFQVKKRAKQAFIGDINGEILSKCHGHELKGENYNFRLTE